MHNLTTKRPAVLEGIKLVELDMRASRRMTKRKSFVTGNAEGFFYTTILLLVALVPMLPASYCAAQDVPPPRPKTVAPNPPSHKPTTTQESAYGILVKVDMDCRISVDGSEPVVMRTGQARRFKSGLGDHLVQAESLDGRAKDEQSVDQKKPQVVVEINLNGALARDASQRQQAQAREEQAQARKEEERLKVEAVQAKLDGLAGVWTKRYFINHNHVIFVLNVSRDAGNSLSGTLHWQIESGDPRSRGISADYSVTITPKEGNDLAVSARYLDCTGSCESEYRVDFTGQLEVKSRAQIVLTGFVWNSEDDIDLQR